MCSWRQGGGGLPAPLAAARSRATDAVSEALALRLLAQAPGDPRGRHRAEGCAVAGKAHLDMRAACASCRAGALIAKGCRSVFDVMKDWGSKRSHGRDSSAGPPALCTEHCAKMGRQHSSLQAPAAAKTAPATPAALASINPVNASTAAAAAAATVPTFTAWQPPVLEPHAFDETSIPA